MTIKKWITRERIYNLVNLSKNGTKVSFIYNIFIAIIAIIDVIYIWGIFQGGATRIDYLIFLITYLILFIDLVLRWITVDFKLKIKGWKVFLLYPFTLMGIMDILALLPGFFVCNGLQFLKLLRFLPLIRKFRKLSNNNNFSIINYTNGINEIANVFLKMKVPFIAATLFLLFFTLLTAIIMFFIEPETYNGTFLDALYWAAISWTGVGYGDIAPTNSFGRVLTLLFALISVILIALPVSVITAGITGWYLRPIIKNSSTTSEASSKDKIEQNSSETTEITEEINFCSVCGTKCAPEDNYCKKCGHKLR